MQWYLSAFLVRHYSKRDAIFRVTMARINVAYARGAEFHSPCVKGKYDACAINYFLIFFWITPRPRSARNCGDGGILRTSFEKCGRKSHRGYIRQIRSFHNERFASGVIRYFNYTRPIVLAANRTRERNHGLGNSKRIPPVAEMKPAPWETKLPANRSWPQHKDNRNRE